MGRRYRSRRRTRQRVPDDAALRRPAALRLRPARRPIIRMQVARQRVGRETVQPAQVGGDALKTRRACGVSRSPMCWLTTTCDPNSSAMLLFKCPPTARIRGVRAFSGPAARASARSHERGAAATRAPAPHAQRSRRTAARSAGRGRRTDRPRRLAVRALLPPKWRSARRSSCAGGDQRPIELRE